MSEYARAMTDEEKRELKVREIPKEHRDAIRAYEDALAMRAIADRRLASLVRDTATAEREANEADTLLKAAWETLVKFNTGNPP